MRFIRQFDKTKACSEFLELLARPVSPTSLALLRIWVGLCMLVEVSRFFGSNWIYRYYMLPKLYFPYPGFGFLAPIPGNGMYWLFIGIGLLSLAVAVGFMYRAASILLFLSFTYVFLLDEANYLNHFYLISLLLLLLSFMPANRAFSLDRMLPKTKWLAAATGQPMRDQIPFWTIFLLRAQLSIVYLYAAIAKMNPDWINGRPLYTWLRDSPIIAFLNIYIPYDLIITFFSWSGLMLDLTAAPLLIWRKTRVLGFVMVLSFHLLNTQLFQIGIFPWMMMGATFIFCAPDFLKFAGQKLDESKIQLRKFTPYLVLIYLGFQILFPFRHVFYPGNISWTEQGHILSWHMKLRNKKSYVSDIKIVNPTTGVTEYRDPDKDLTRRQLKKMKNRPRLQWHYAQWLATHYETKWGIRPQIYMKVWSSLNCRDYQLLIDPDRDLATTDYSLFANDWILPLTVNMDNSHHRKDRRCPVKFRKKLSEW